ncbi:MAG: carbon-nitrogen hydrolase family protein [Thermincola sp.]|nr:carbon-nitrogen hydrolase family protein [Thermincola sp.]MDT3702606.1 carbon-nitrogen hydrolase family protein [Thermincola sp.]
MRVAAAQINVEFSNTSANLDKVVHYLREAGQQGVELVVFPECSLSGYVFQSYEEVLPFAEEIPGKTTRALGEICRQYNISALVGMLELDGDDLFNTAVIISPAGLVGKYRKTHTLCLGLDRFIAKGDRLECLDLFEHKVGVIICYDQRFPEAARVLALKGAQVILHSANLPEGTQAYADFLNRARACENRVFFVHVNRVGDERGVHFIGRSQIINHLGEVIAEANQTDEQLIIADIDLNLTKDKYVIKTPGEYEFDLFGDRRSVLYKPII